MNYLIGVDNSTAKLLGGYARQAYLDGLAMQDTRGYNPYTFGFVGAGDSHDTATAYSQANFFVALAIPPVQGGADPVPPPRSRDNDPGIEPGVHRQFGGKRRAASDRPEL